MKKIMYVGSLRSGDNGPDRAAAFQRQGFEILPADRYGFLTSGLRLERSLAARINLGRSVLQFNKMLQSLCRSEKYDAIFVDKGVWVWPETLRELKRRSRADLAVHYTPDSQFLENRSRHFLGCLPLYDACFTTKQFELAEYKKHGARVVKLILQGYGERLKRLSASEISNQFQSEVVFIGHFQKAYATKLSALSEHVPLTIWGPNWPKYSKRAVWARHCVRGSGVFGTDYSQALSGAKIGVGLLSKRIPETSTTRTFEIPACGTMLLAERTPEHQALFEEDSEAVFFGDIGELCEKARYYLKNDSARSKIAESGYYRSVSSGYRVDQQFQLIFDFFKDAL